MQANQGRRSANIAKKPIIKKISVFWNPNNSENKQEVIIDELLAQQIRQGNWRREKP
jgi:hypothetical protein